MSKKRKILVLDNGSITTAAKRKADLPPPQFRKGEMVTVVMSGKKERGQIEAVYDDLVNDWWGWWAVVTIVDGPTASRVLSFSEGLLLLHNPRHMADASDLLESDAMTAWLQRHGGNAVITFDGMNISGSRTPFEDDTQPYHPGQLDAWARAIESIPFPDCPQCSGYQQRGWLACSHCGKRLR